MISFLCIHAGEGLSIILWHSLLQLEILGGYTASWKPRMLFPRRKAVLNPSVGRSCALQKPIAI